MLYNEQQPLIKSPIDKIINGDIERKTSVNFLPVYNEYIIDTITRAITHKNSAKCKPIPSFIKSRSSTRRPDNSPTKKKNSIIIYFILFKS